MDSNEMREQQQTNTESTIYADNFEVLLEVEVTESLCAAISRGKRNSLEQDGMVEVTATRPGSTTDAFTCCPELIGTNLKTIDKSLKKSRILHEAIPYRRSATIASDRRRIPHLDQRQSKSFVSDGVRECPTIILGEVVGDLPLKFPVASSDNKESRSFVKLHHGDHCDASIFNSKTIKGRDLARKSLKGYVDGCYFEMKPQGVPNYIDPLVYQVHLQKEEIHDQKKCPLIEIGAAQKILEKYTISDTDAAWCDAKNEIIETIRKTLSELGDNARGIAGTHFHHESDLFKCRHCGVISLIKPQGITSDETYLLTGNTNDISAVFDTLQASDQISPKEFDEENTSQNKSWKSCTESRLKVDTEEVVKESEISSGVECNKFYPQRPPNVENIDAPSRQQDTVTPERETDVIDRKKERKTRLPLLTTKKNNKPNDTRFRSIYSPRKVTAESDKKPAQIIKPPDNSNTVKAQGKNLMRHAYESRETKASLLRYAYTSSRKNQKGAVNSPKVLSPPSSPSNIPTRVEKTKTKNLPTVLDDPGCTDFRQRNLRPSRRQEDNELKSAGEVWSSKDKILPVSGVGTHLVVSSELEESSADQSYSGDRRVDNSDNDQRSFYSIKNCQPSVVCTSINADVNYSAPSISFTRNAFGIRNSRTEHVAKKNFRTGYNGESESTVFSSSSSENTIQECADPPTQVSMMIGNALPSRKKEAVQKFASKAALSEGKPRGNAALAEFNALRIMKQMNVAAHVDRCTGQFVRLKSESYVHSSAGEGGSLTNLTPDTLLRLVSDRRMPEFKVQECRAPSCEKKMDIKDLLIDGSLAANARQALRKPKNDGELETLGDTIGVPSARTTFKKSLKKALKMRYKNPATVSSSSEYSSEGNRENGVQQGSSSNKKNSSRDISTGSKEDQPVYRKILESKDQMNWDTFQQLVGTLHPSQRELWCDICKAISNEAKRVSGVKGTSTEVCIEINPIPDVQAIPCEQRSWVKTSDNEVSFEMDMILNDCDMLLDQKSHGDPETLYGPERCL